MHEFGELPAAFPPSQHQLFSTDTPASGSLEALEALLWDQMRRPAP